MARELNNVAWARRMSGSELVAGPAGWLLARRLWNPRDSWTWFDGECPVRRDQVRSAGWLGTTSRVVWVVPGELSREGGSESSPDARRAFFLCLNDDVGVPSRATRLALSLAFISLSLSLSFSFSCQGCLSRDRYPDT
jgi:hypothetical protein